VSTPVLTSVNRPDTSDTSDTSDEYSPSQEVRGSDDPVPCAAEMLGATTDCWAIDGGPVHTLRPHLLDQERPPADPRTWRYLA
jgi:hypothetical protein